MTVTHPAVQRASQSLEPGDLVHLYIVDLSPLGKPLLWHFCPTGEVVFGGVVYNHVDIEAEGFEWTGRGTLPQPKVRIANTTRLIAGELTANDNLIGARITRIKTYKQFLDSGDTPDPEAMFSPEVYVFERKASHNKFQIEWVLSAAMDQQGRMVPGRMVIRDFCMWRYRVWNEVTASYDYSKAQCPYNGANAFDALGQPTTPDKDTPSRKFNTCCKVRFGNNAVYPFGGFPGVARARV